MSFENEHAHQEDNKRLSEIEEELLKIKDHDPTSILFHLVDLENRKIGHDFLQRITGQSVKRVILKGPAGVGKDTVVTALIYSLEKVYDIRISIVDYGEHIINHLRFPGDRSLDWTPEYWDLFDRGIEESLRDEPQNPLERIMKIGVVIAEGAKEIRNRAITAADNVAQDPTTIEAEIIGDPRIFEQTEEIRNIVLKIDDNYAEYISEYLDYFYGLKVVGIGSIKDAKERGMAIKKFFAHTGSSASIQDILDLMHNKALEIAKNRGGIEQIYAIPLPQELDIQLKPHQKRTMQEHIFLAEEKFRELNIPPDRYFILINCFLPVTTRKYLRIDPNKYA